MRRFVCDERSFIWFVTRNPLVEKWVCVCVRMCNSSWGKQQTVLMQFHLFSQLAILCKVYQIRYKQCYIEWCVRPMFHQLARSICVCLLLYYVRNWANENLSRMKNNAYTDLTDQTHWGVKIDLLARFAYDYFTIIYFLFLFVSFLSICWNDETIGDVIKAVQKKLKHQIRISTEENE